MFAIIIARTLVLMSLNKWLHVVFIVDIGFGPVPDFFEGTGFLNSYWFYAHACMFEKLWIFLSWYKWKQYPKGVQKIFLFS